MDLLMTLLFFVVGLALIVKGGDIFVDAASWMAEVLHIPKFLIGATIVSFATTLPELLVSLFAALEGKVDMAVGNAVGSVTVNTGLIMGVSIVCIPALVQRRNLLVPAGLMLSSTALLLLFAQATGQLAFWPSLLLLALFALAMGYNIRNARRCLKEGQQEESEKPGAREVGINLLKFALGAVSIVLGAQLLVDNGSELARLLGVPESIIGVTLVAIGTSLPELVTTITAIAKRQAQLSVGNIVGANVIDMTMILPLCTIFSGKALPFSLQGIALDLPVCLGVGVLALVPALLFGKFRRWQGVGLLACYGAYVFVLVTGAWM